MTRVSETDLVPQGKLEKLAVLLEDVKRARAHFNQTNTVRMMVALLKKRQAAMAVELTCMIKPMLLIMS